MDLLFFAALVLGVLVLKTREQRARIALLGRHLARYDIEQLMEGLTEGYLRALGEADAERQAQVWSFLAVQEEKLRQQFQAFARDVAQEDAAVTRVSTLPVALPLATTLLPVASFDLRAALALHARAIAQAVDPTGRRSQKDRAYTLSAELFLMQHTCHWFCRSKAVASARLLARHRSSYAQVLAAVAPETRDAYAALTGVRAPA